MKSTIAAALFSLFACNAAHATILVNGNFEHGTTGWTTYGDASLASHSGSGFYNGAGSITQDGAHAIVFNSDLVPLTGGLLQTFATTAGTTYTLSFDYGSTNIFFQSMAWSVIGSNPLSALAGGIVSDIGGGKLDSYTIDFIAGSATTTLLFADIYTAGALLSDGILDNVSVVAKTNDNAGTPPPAAVPEPASLALLGVGLLGAGAVRRRKTA